MVLYQHSDVIQWGLQLLDGEPAYNPGYYGEIIQHNTGDVYNGHYYQSHYDNEGDQVENDEIIARTLQEDFSQLEIAECSSYSQAGEEQFHVSEPAYDWHSSSMMSYYPGGINKAADYLYVRFIHKKLDILIRNFIYADHHYVHEGFGDIQHSCSSPCDKEESLQLTNDYSLDDEVGKKFSQMIPIPHVPRINGEIPSIDEATSDHQRLLDRLQLYDFVEQKVQGDGNCQFRALSDQLYGSPEHHEFVRQQVVNQLKTHPEIYEGYVPMAYDEYLEKMSKNGEWGDHVTLQAAADSYDLKIFVVTSFKDTCYIEIHPHSEKPKQGIFLSFWAEVHYNSIYPQGDTRSIELRKKKRWWNFRSKHQR